MTEIACVPAAWGFFGLALGSFVNVVIFRLQRGKSLVTPASHCPRCKKNIRYVDNIPLLSYALLGGRCRHCRGRIPWRYPLVEAIVGALALALFFRYPGEPAWVLASACAAAAFTAVAFIDWDTRLIPHELSWSLIGLGLLCAPLNPLFAGSAFRGLAESAAGAAAGCMMTLLIAVLGEWIFRHEAMGGGDVFLMTGVGAWTGALGAYDCMLMASLFGAVYGLSVLLKKHSFAGFLRRYAAALKGQAAKEELTYIPFGPFLCAAAIINFFYILPFGFPL